MSASPYCKTCHNAGKSYEEYTNHWTRDKPGSDGKIVCPIILNSICRHCNQKGHWLKYCPLIHEQNKQTNTDDNSWANKLKQSISKINPFKQNITFDTEFYSLNTTNKQFNENIDVSISTINDDENIELENIFRPPSPNYPPPPH